jgi:cytochrome c oxidase subunit 4
MSNQGSESGSLAVGSRRLFFSVWLWLVVLTAIEVVLGYETSHFTPGVMLSLLVILSIVKAALIIAYFMHLKYEKTGLALILIPSAIFCMCMIIIFFMPDSLRLLEFRLPH